MGRAGSGWLPLPQAVGLGLLGSGGVGLLAYQRGSLTKSGVVGAILTGTTMFAAGGPVPAMAMLTFFISSSGLSFWRRKGKEQAVVEAAKGSRRDLAQTLANGGVAALCALAGYRSPNGYWLPATVGALATVNADTWATELGLLSSQQPRLITTWEPVPAGTSGGVTRQGWLATVLGAVLIGAVSAVGQGIVRQSGRMAIGYLPVGLLAGVGGAVVDSFLGATVQARYYCPQCQVATERPMHRCGTPAIQVGGIRLLDNDWINGLASLSGALFGAATARFLRLGAIR